MAAVKKASRLDRLEQIARIVATLLIPVVLGIGGWVLQSTIESGKQRSVEFQTEQQRASDRERIAIEYVKIAKEVLTSADKTIPKELTRWSWQLLNDAAPTKFAQGDLARLIEQNERIPGKSVVTRTFTAVFQLSENAKYHPMPFYKEDGEAAVLRCRLVYPDNRGRRTINVFVNDMRTASLVVQQKEERSTVNDFELVLDRSNIKFFEAGRAVSAFQTITFQLDETVRTEGFVAGQCLLLVTEK